MFSFCDACPEYRNGQAASPFPERNNPVTSQIGKFRKEAPRSLACAHCCQRLAYSFGRTIPFCAWYLPFRSA